MKKVSS